MLEQKNMTTLSIPYRQCSIYSSIKFNQFNYIKIIGLLLALFIISGCSQSADKLTADHIEIEPDFERGYSSITNTEQKAGADLGNGTYDVSLQSSIPTKSTNNLNSPSETASKIEQKVKRQPAKKRRMIWKASLEFQVEDMEVSSKRISKICEAEGGFISGMNMSSTNYKIQNNVQIRVNNDHFHQLIDKLKGESIYIDNISITSNDVTEEFIDIESRLKTKKEVRDRYINILRKKTGSIKEVIEAEEAIRRITEEIEAKEGRLRFLKDQVNFSTITVSIYQKVEYNRAPEVYEKSFGDDISDSFSNGWQFVTILFLLLINIWPLILAGLIFIIWWRIRKKKRQV